jgi:hypothetical protein
MISASSIKMFKSKAFVVAGVATLGAISAQPAQAITGFTGPYAPTNWTNGSTYGGSVDTSGAPGSIILKIPPVADFLHQNLRPTLFHHQAQARYRSTGAPVLQTHI